MKNVAQMMGNGFQSAEQAHAEPRAPSAGLLSKGRLALDLAFCSYWHHKHQKLQNPVGYYLLCDSSPQVGQEWFLTELWVLQGSHYELKELFLKMTSLASGLVEGLQEKDAIVKEIEHHFYRHVCPPMVLGSKRGQLPHKLHALLQTLFLESQQWRQVRQTLVSLVSLTTDLGTESYLSTVKASDTGLASCIPKIGDCSTALADLRGEDPHLECPWPVAKPLRAGPGLC